MRTMFFTQAVDDALAQAMADDPRIVLFGEDTPLLRHNLLAIGPQARTGRPHQRKRFSGGWCGRCNGRIAPSGGNVHGGFPRCVHGCSAQPRR